MKENEMINKRTFINNISYAFLAQIISLFLSILMALIVPQVLGIKEFSYWQLFLFYSGYCGFFHFGLNDGIYLKEGGKQYENLKIKIIGSQFKIALTFHIIISLCILILSYFGIQDNNRRFVWIAAAIYLPIFNATGFIGYIFQAVNKTRLYSLSVIIDKIFFILAVVTLILMKNNDFRWFIILFIIAKIISLAFCILNAKEILYGKCDCINSIIKEMVDNILVGINLMISNIAGTLILGIGRYMSDKRWGIEAFGKISFAILMANLFLTFIGQISMVLFPTLRKLDDNGLRKFYNNSRSIITMLLPGILLIYIPIKYVLGLWLPEYKESLEYLSLLLPLCVYDGKMKMICNTYFKVMRKEKLLLKLNAISLIFSSILSFVATYILNNINYLVIAMVVSIAFRSIISDIYLAKFMKEKVVFDISIEIMLVIVFMLCTYYFNNLYSFIVYLIIYIVYIIFFYNKKKILIKWKVGV